MKKITLIEPFESHDATLIENHPIMRDDDSRWHDLNFCIEQLECDEGCITYVIESINYEIDDPQLYNHVKIVDNPDHHTTLKNLYKRREIMEELK